MLLMVPGTFCGIYFNHLLLVIYDFEVPYQIALDGFLLFGDGNLVCFCAVSKFFVLLFHGSQFFALALALGFRH